MKFKHRIEIKLELINSDNIPGCVLNIDINASCNEF